MELGPEPLFRDFTKFSAAAEKISRYPVTPNSTRTGLMQPRPTPASMLVCQPLFIASNAAYAFSSLKDNVSGATSDATGDLSSEN